MNLNRNIALDANASFTKEDCLFIQETPGFQKLMYIEQPLEMGNFGILKTAIQLIGWQTKIAKTLLFRKLKPHYSSINIKLMKCGGLTPALEMITEAKN